MIRRPAVRYYGGKFQLSGWIIQHIPSHVLYCEPFGLELDELGVEMDVKKMIEDIQAMEPGLERAILRIISFHIGKENAIKKGDILKELAGHGFQLDARNSADERKFRLIVSKLRKDGHLICSSAGEFAGYFIPNTWTELDEFRRVELWSRIADLQDTDRRLKAAGELVLGKYNETKQTTFL